MHLIDPQMPPLYSIANARLAAAAGHCPDLVTAPLPTIEDIQALLPGDAIFVLLCVDAHEVGKRWWWRTPLFVLDVERPNPNSVSIHAQAAVPVADLGIEEGTRFAVRLNQVLEVSPCPSRAASRQLNAASSTRSAEEN